MFSLLCFFLTVLVSPFKSKSRLEAENAALRPQLILMRRKVRGRIHLTNGDRRSSGSIGARHALGRLVVPQFEILVDAAKIVMHVVKGDRQGVVFELL
jgi:hypothetical protein